MRRVSLSAADSIVNESWEGGSSWAAAPGPVKPAMSTAARSTRRCLMTSGKNFDDDPVGVFGELAAVGDPAILDDEQAGQRGHGVLLGEGAIRVQEHRRAHALAGQEALDGP